MAAPELKTLGRYNLERVLGKGAMGVVYEGVDPRLGRRVAIKTILKSHLDEDTAKDYSMRFVREAQAVARLNHPNIVQVYDFGEETDIAYLVMEFIKGKELKTFFDANERFDLKEAVRIMCELCDALDFAHQAGIVHRDIKPANVMLDSQARTKLTDFGVARVTDSDKTSVERTQAGTMVGTPAYMSPEQITGGNIDRRSDVFSAGIILYQFLTGEKPFTGSGAWTIAKKIIQEEPPLPSSINNTVTPLFDAVVNKALAKNPDSRYQSARDLAAALRRALEGKPEEDDSDKTVVGAIGAHIAPRPAAPAPQAPAAEGTRGSATGGGGTHAGNQEIELEFWRAIKDGNDPDDFDLYVQQFPTGIYAALAKRKIAKLRGVAPEETGARAREQEKKEAEEAARKEAEARAKLADEKAKLEAELARKEEEYRKREAEAEAKRIAAEKARAAAEAKREVEAKARAEAEEKARREAIEKAKQEAQAELARRDAEYKKREAEAEAKRQAEAKARADADEKARREAIERAKQEAQAELAKRDAEYKKREAEAEAKRQAEAKARAEAEAKARAEAEVKAKHDAELRVKAEAEAKVKRDAEEKARREADAKAKAEAQAQGKREAEERAKRDAEYAKREAELKRRVADAEAAPGGRKRSPVAPIVVGVMVAAIGGGVWYAMAPDKIDDARVTELQKQLAEAKTREVELQQVKQREAQAVKELELARQREAEAKKSGDVAKQRELAEQTKQREAEAKKQADAAKVATEQKVAAEKASAKSAEQTKQRETDQQAKLQRDSEARKQADAARQAADKAAAEKLAAEKAAMAQERQRLAADKAAAEKAAAEARVATEKASVERLAAEKAKEQAAKVASAAPAVAGGDGLFQQGAALETEGKGREAVKLYTQAARSGNGKAAKRLGEIYDKGLIGISRDYAESLKWYNAARVLGEDVPMAKSR